MTKYDYKATNIYGNTALHEAAADGNIEAVKLLVEHDKGSLRIEIKKVKPRYLKLLHMGKQRWS
ncbi:hypothetical protein Patl1_09862 [Pistacia atlantica]|uniref:Uncharacterized protein n=1 Tax=Pistacia atlantica TaxID=434234 RepID=A0ACC1A7W3_9ROSI|nr:hypothetical protein Patl1_09862 [Pistacia atlantica]